MPPVSQVKRPRMDYKPGEPGANLFCSAPPLAQDPQMPVFPPPPFSMPAATTSTPRRDQPAIRLMFDETGIANESSSLPVGPSIPAGGDMSDIADIADFVRQVERPEGDIDDIIRCIDGLDLNNLYIHAIERSNMLDFQSSLDTRKVTIVLNQRGVRFRFVLHSCGFNNTRCICIKNKLLELPMDERKNKRVNPHNVHNLNYVNTIYAFFANVFYKHFMNVDYCHNSPEMLGFLVHFKSAGK